MKGLRLLNNGQWNKPPLLMAARRIVFNGLTPHFRGCALGEAATFLNGTSYDVQQVSESGKAPIIRISNITDPLSAYLRTNEMLGQRFRVDQGDLLVSWSASFKSIIWPGQAGYLNQHIFKVTEREGFDRRFIRHAIEASFEQMQENVVGIGMMHLRRSDFLDHPIPAPPLGLQRRVADFLDFIEFRSDEKPPQLPPMLAEEARVIARMADLVAQTQEARSLRHLAVEEADALVVSNHIQLSGGRTRRLGEILRLDEDAVPVRADGSYPQVGVRSFGQGLFAKSAISGTETTYRSFNRLFEGALVLSQVKGWEGAVAVCPKKLSGWLVSPEYRTFRCIEGEARPGYLSSIIPTEWFWGRLTVATRGAGDRRERTRPEQFLNIEVPMPDWHGQEFGERVFHEVDALKGLQAETAAELDAMLPAILHRAFNGEL